ncbi:MAG: tripartite tricarboxylate transporter substrate binding protein [Hyphomicrobiales bacterium]|nr:tripartite tricarboxylate transporter substrate binding protein [Hyphomicrobiales bacterium]
MVVTRSLLSTLLLAALVGGAAANEFPTRPIRIIAPIAAGGPSDTAARLAADALRRQFGQSVLVENRTGAGGVIGTEAAAQAKPDGYTLLLSIAATFTVIPAVKRTSYDPQKDFVPLGQIWSAPQALVVNAKSTMKSLADLVDYGKKHPGKLTFGSAGVGTTTHLSIGLLSREARIEVVHLPYRGTSQSVTDVVGGQIDAIFGDVSNLAPLVETGSLAALAVTGTERSPLLPNVPTTAEAGYPNVRTINWYGLHAPAGVPPAVLDRLTAAVAAIQQDPRFLESLAKHAASTGTLGARQFDDMIREEVARLTPLVRSLGVTFN